MNLWTSMTFVRFQRCLNISKWIWHDLDWFGRISQSVAWSCTIQEFSRVHKAKQDLQLRTAAESKDLQVLAGTIQVRNGANHLADLLSFVQVFTGVQFVSMKEHCNMHQKSSEEGRLEGHLDAFYIMIAAGQSEVILQEEVLPISHLSNLRLLFASAGCSPKIGPCTHHRGKRSPGAISC